MPEKTPASLRTGRGHVRFARQTWINLGIQLGALILAFLLTSLILLIAGAPPFEAYVQIARGAVGSLSSFTNVLVAWVPLLLAASGVLITFAAGLWNIGVEGQIVLGAVLTTWVLRLLQETSLSPALIIVLAMIAGIVGGALWAGLAGILKTFGGSTRSSEALVSTTWPQRSPCGSSLGPGNVRGSAQ